MNKAFCEALGIEYCEGFDIPHSFNIPEDAKCDKTGSRNPHWGLKHTDDAKRLISANRTGKNTNTSENCEKKRQAFLENNPNYNLEYLQKNIDARAKMYRVIDPNGNEFTVKNMAKFCRENNLHRGNMCAVAKGEMKQAKGWKCFYLPASSNKY